MSLASALFKRTSTGIFRLGASKLFAPKCFETNAAKFSAAQRIKFPNQTFCTLRSPSTLALNRTALQSRSFATWRRTSFFVNRNGGQQQQESEPNNDNDNNNDRARKIGMMGTVASIGLLLASKSSYVFGILKLGKFWTLFSMVGTSLAYSLVFGWPYAVGMVAMIFVHESGHAWEMHRQGIESSPMVFIPFVGAVVGMKGQPITVYNEAKIALAGPLSGSVAAFATSMYGIATGSQLLIALADFGLMINLFNLLPIGYLDGGRVASALSKYILLGGMGLGISLALSGTLSSPLFYLILLLGGFSTFNRFFGDSDVPPSYYEMSDAQRLWILVAYLGLIGTLLGAHTYNRKYLRTRVRQFEQYE